MRIKINRRIIQVTLVCFIVAIALVGALYYALESVTAPEPLVDIYSYTKNIRKGSIISQLDIKKVQIPKRLYSYGLAEEIDDIVGKKVVANVNEGEFVYEDKLTYRGRIESDFNDLYVIGLDVNNISNILGTELKVNDTYYLIYEELDKELSIQESYEKKSIKVTILSLINSTGNTIVGEKETQVKTINVGVRKNDDLFEILKLKKTDRVEIVRYPIEEELSIEPINVDKGKVNTKILTLKNGVMLYVH